jgi:hypothetical protein
MLVTLTRESEVFPLSQHPGAEFLAMLEGETEYGYAGTSSLMPMGGSLQFDGEVPHGRVRLTRLSVRFISVTASGQPPD